jgi:hypothetical protein
MPYSDPALMIPHDDLHDRNREKAKQAKAERIAAEKRRVTEVKLHQEQKRIADAKAFTIGRALMAEMEEKPGTNQHVQRNSGPQVDNQPRASAF